ncbi:MAG: transglycosylase SLT domain-containing protein [Alphaproteobacteria bacterium]
MTTTPATVPGGSRPDATLGAIRSAAARTGVDFAFMLAQAAVESGFDPAAQAPTSSARGLYQFTDATWLAMVRDYGHAVGLGAYQDLIVTDTAGRATIADGAERERLLALRDDPRLSAELAARLARENRAAMEATLGDGRVGATELYLAHFLGAGQATRFAIALRATPGAAAADLFPVEAKANRGVFYDANGRARTLSEVHGLFDRRLADAVRDVQAGSFAVAIERAPATSAPGTAAPVSSTGRSGSASWQPGQGYAATLDPLVVLVLASLDAPERARAKLRDATTTGTTA